MAKERRRAERLQPPESMLLIFDCNQSIIGRIQSISATGVSVVYEDGLCRPLMDQDILIRIINERRQSDPPHAMRCTPVYDIPTLSHRLTFKGKQMRLFGMHFNDLSPADRQRIQRWLERSSRV